ncbi:MAG: sterol-binding protein [Cytophagales bacterium]|nr:MAG: sterol-binding protein [Cytophagales bacterium]
MSLEATTQKISGRAAATADLGSSVKFVFGEGVIYLDGKGGITNDNTDAACTVSMDIADFNAMLEGSLNPMSAFMGGKMRIDGDMSVAMKLQSIFG